MQCKHVRQRLAARSVIERARARDDVEAVARGTIDHRVHPLDVVTVQPPMSGHEGSLRPEHIGQRREQLFRWSIGGTRNARTRHHRDEPHVVRGEDVELEQGLPLGQPRVGMREETAEVRVAGVVLREERHGGHVQERGGALSVLAGPLYRIAPTRRTERVRPIDDLPRLCERKLCADDEALPDFSRAGEGTHDPVEPVPITESDGAVPEALSPDGRAPPAARRRGETRTTNERTVQKTRDAQATEHYFSIKTGPYLTGTLETSTPP